MLMPELDYKTNRSARKWSRREQFGRIAWALVHPLFSLSPRPFWIWRRWLLRLFGAQVGPGVHIYPSVRIEIPWNLCIGNHSAIGDRAILYALGPITIGSRVTISQGAHLCAGSHNWQRPDRPLTKPPITILDDSWICADAFVGPGVTIGEKAIVGACGVVIKDVAAGLIVAGNPAKSIHSN